MQDPTREVLLFTDKPTDTCAVMTGPSETGRFLTTKLGRSNERQKFFETKNVQKHVIIKKKRKKSERVRNKKQKKKGEIGIHLTVPFSELDTFQTTSVST
jgi:hypothetical protein